MRVWKQLLDWLILLQVDKSVEDIYGKWLVYLSPRSLHFVGQALSEFTH